jgi:hypothetical protein
LLSPDIVRSEATDAQTVPLKSRLKARPASSWRLVLVMMRSFDGSVDAWLRLPVSFPPIYLHRFHESRSAPWSGV